MTVLKELDPEGVSQRARRRLKRRIYRNKVIVSLINPIMIVYHKCLNGIFFTQGPNYLWHCDGYDKLTPYGLTIHGCIDG